MSDAALTVLVSRGLGMSLNDPTLTPLTIRIAVISVVLAAITVILNALGLIPPYAIWLSHAGQSSAITSPRSTVPQAADADGREISDIPATSLPQSLPTNTIVSVLTDTPIMPTLVPPTPVPQTATMMLHVPGNNPRGTPFRATSTGTHIIRYIDGAYSTYPVGKGPNGTLTWLTAVFVYKGVSVQWDGDRIRDEDTFVRIADNSYFATRDEAINAARIRNTERTIYLSAGEIITLIAVDGQSFYDDNPGNIDLEIVFTR